MGARIRFVVSIVSVVLATAVVPSVGFANDPAGAPPQQQLGTAISTGAQQDGGIGGTASVVAGLGLADDSVLHLMGLTPPGDPYSGPSPPPICGPGCGA